MALKKTAVPPTKKAPLKGDPASAKRPSKAAVASAKPAPAATVTLKHLAAEVATNNEMSKKQAEAEFQEIVGLVVSHLKAGDRLRLGGLGILEVKNRPARSGRNPATGAVIQIAASKKIAFRPAKELKQAI